MRLFISIQIPEDIKKKIKRIQESLPEFIGKNTESENLHLTLKFLGKVDEKKLEIIKNKLREIKFNSFEAEINSIGFFNNKTCERRHQEIIFWLNLKNCEKLQKEIDKSLVGLFEEEKRFMGHLTIARIKKIINKKKFTESMNNLKFEKMIFRVDSFYLQESHLFNKGPKYDIIEKYNLS